MNEARRREALDERIGSSKCVRASRRQTMRRLAFNGSLKWAAFRELPLTDKEFRTIAQNLAPYMRW